MLVKLMLSLSLLLDSSAHSGSSLLLLLQILVLSLAHHLSLLHIAIEVLDTQIKRIVTCIVIHVLIGETGSLIHIEIADIHVPTFIDHIFVVCI